MDPAHSLWIPPTHYEQIRPRYKDPVLLKKCHLPLATYMSMYGSVKKNVPLRGNQRNGTFLELRGQKL